MTRAATIIDGIYYTGDDAGHWLQAGKRVVQCEVFCSARYAAGDYGRVRLDRAIVSVDCNGASVDYVSAVLARNGATDCRQAIGVYAGKRARVVVADISQANLERLHDSLRNALIGFGCYAIFSPLDDSREWQNRTAKAYRKLKRDALKRYQAILDTADGDVLADAADWYRLEGLAVKSIGERYGADAWKACEVASAVSPRCKWEHARDVYLPAALGDSDCKPHPMQAFRDTATACAEGSTLRYSYDASKRWAYARNLFDATSSAVTIDVHMLLLAGMDSQTAPNGWQYLALADAVRELAAGMRMSPRDVQAQVWVAGQNLAGRFGPTSKRVKRLNDDLPS
jgi:hypothetical protein